MCRPSGSSITGFYPNQAARVCVPRFFIWMVGLFISIGTEVSCIVLSDYSPVTEGGSVNLDNAILHEGLGSDQLVVAGIVDDVQDTCLAGLAWEKIHHTFRQGSSLQCKGWKNLLTFWAPGEVTLVSSEGTVLPIATSGPYDVYPLGTELDTQQPQ